MQCLRGRSEDDLSAHKETVDRALDAAIDSLEVTIDQLSLPRDGSSPPLPAESNNLATNDQGGDCLPPD